MKAIVQHNFNTGFGDGLFAMTDYITNAKKLKELGFKIKLEFNLSLNLYFKDKSPIDYLDKESFNMFDEIVTTNNPIYETNKNGYTCVFTHANAKPGQHYWDLFINDESLDFYYKNHIIENFNMNSMVSGKLPSVFPKLSSEILEKYNEFVKTNNLYDFDAIYFRTQDLDEELDFLESKKERLNQIINSGRKIFFCSNSKEFKKYIKSFNNENLYYWEIPLEDEWGGNHLLHQRIDNENLHQRTIYTLLDMWTLCCSKNIHFFTTWGRYSNFMIYAPINNSKINFC